MITEEQVISGEVSEDTRVFYTKKDGTKIYGTVRHIYLDSKTLSMKPDRQYPLDLEHSPYPQTYRFKRLTVAATGRAKETVTIFGRQLAPLVVMASSKTTPDDLKSIFSCEDGLFTYDRQKLYLEKIKGLKTGAVNDKHILEEMPQVEVQASTFYDEIVKQTKKTEAHEEYQSFKRQRRAARIKIDILDFTRSVKDIEYSTGKYHAKWSDVATVLIKDGSVEVDVFDKNKDLCTVNKLISGVLSATGKSTSTFMLHDLRDFTKAIRTKEAEIEVYNDGTMVLETEEQMRILYPLEKIKARIKERRVKSVWTEMIY